VEQVDDELEGRRGITHECSPYNRIRKPHPSWRPTISRGGAFVYLQPPSNSASPPPRANFLRSPHGCSEGPASVRVHRPSGSTLVYQKLLYLRVCLNFGTFHLGNPKQGWFKYPL